MALRFGIGKASVRIDGVLGEQIEREVRALLGPVVDELERKADEILANEIARKWPVKTGKSRDSWSKVLTIHRGSFSVEVSLLSPLEYTRYIRSTRLGEQDDAVRLRSPLVAHVRRPATKARKELRRALPEILGRHLQGILDG